VGSDEPVIYSYDKLFLPGEFDGRLSLELYYCEDEEAPTRWTSGMKVLCRLDCKVGMAYSKLRDFTSPETGEVMKTLGNIQVRMKPSGASAEFTVYIDGELQAQQNVDIVLQ
jgi:allantoicase